MIRYVFSSLLLVHGLARAEEQIKRPSETEAVSSSEIRELKTQVAELRQLVERQQQALTAIQKRLDERQATSPTASNAPQAAEKAGPLAGWANNRAFLRSADGRFETGIIGYAQLDFHGYQSGSHPPNTFLIRRARLGMEGRVERYFGYKVEGDFADTAGTLLRDLYVRIQRVDAFQLTFGQFRVPISQEEMRFDAVQDFTERSMVNALVPSRSPGLMASGVLKRGAVEYQVGAFNGKGLLAANNTGTPESALRLRLSPFKNKKDSPARGFSFGGAFTEGRNDAGVSIRGQTESRSYSFFLPETVNGKQTRANGELTWMLGPAAVRAEYVQTHQQRTHLGAGGTNLPGVVGKGYMAQLTYLLTGETKPEAAAVAPRRALFHEGSGDRGFGAWELKARYANLQIADGTSRSNRADTLFFGVNWYMNRFVSHLVDFGFERFKDPMRSPRPGDGNFFVLLTRLQVTFSAR
jgi:phosphate-selective porin OprO/OprP